jgi:primosomal protein N''
MVSSTTKEDLEQKLKSALNELEIWEQQGAQRQDGSQAQDRRFDERGDNLRSRVSDIRHQLNQLEENESRGLTQ